MMGGAHLPRKCCCIFGHWDDLRQLLQLWCLDYSKNEGTKQFPIEFEHAQSQAFPIFTPICSNCSTTFTFTCLGADCHALTEVISKQDVAEPADYVPPVCKIPAVSIAHEKEGASYSGKYEEASSRREWK